MIFIDLERVSTQSIMVLYHLCPAAVVVRNLFVEFMGTRKNFCRGEASLKKHIEKK